MTVGRRKNTGIRSVEKGTGGVDECSVFVPYETMLTL